jgi:hypothetical protein
MTLAFDVRHIGRLRCIPVAAGVLLMAHAAAQGIRWQPLCEPGCGGWITSLCVSPHDSNRILIGGDLLGIGVSTDRGDSWRPGFGLRSWEVCDFTWHPKDPDTVWVGTYSGPYVSHDAGATWEERRRGFPDVSGGMYTAPVEKVLYDPANVRRLLAFGGTSRRWQTPGKPAYGAVWESTDDGDTWRRLAVITGDGSTTDSAVQQGVNVVAVGFDSGLKDTVYALSDAGGVHVSTDGGKTWENRNAGLPPVIEIGRLAIHPTQAGRAYIGMKWTRDADGKPRPGGVFETTDAAQTWVSKSAGLPMEVTDAGNQNLISNYGAVALAPSRPETLYTCDANWAQCVIYRSDDGGESWRPVACRGERTGPDGKPIPQVRTALFAGLAMGHIAVDPRDPAAVFAINSEYIARTLDPALPI